MAWSKKAKQDWTIGNVVRVGFVDDLEVMEKIATPGDYRPNQYVLRQRRTGNLYSFVPHNGLSRCGSLDEARAW